MTKKAKIGGVLMLLFLCMGVFGNVTLNGEIVENKLTAIIVSVFMFPVLMILLGFLFGFIKDVLVAFLGESFAYIFKKNQPINHETIEKVAPESTKE